MKKISRRNKGFSLVELIIVIAIMAALVGILAPQYIKYVDKARQTACLSSLNTLKTSYYLEMNSAANGDFKENLTEALSAYTSPVIGTSGDTCTATVTGVCPSDGVYSITVSLQSGSVTAMSCSKHGSKTIESLSAGENGADYLQKAFSGLLAEKKITLSGGKFDSNGTRQTPLIKDALSSMGYTIGDNTMWKIVAKSETEFCIYMADLTNEQMDLLDAGKYSSVKGVKGTQVYYLNGEKTDIITDAGITFGKVEANDASYCVISNYPIKY